MLYSCGFPRPLGGLCPKFGVILIRSRLGGSISPYVSSGCLEYCGSCGCLVHSSMLSVPIFTMYLSSLFIFFCSLQLCSTDFIVW